MKIAKWGNSLAIRIPAIVAEALDLKAGDEVVVRASECAKEHGREIAIQRKPDIDEMFARIRRFRGLMPADWKFDREEANERG